MTSSQAAAQDVPQRVQPTADLPALSGASQDEVFSQLLGVLQGGAPNSSIAVGAPAADGAAAAPVGAQVGRRRRGLLQGAVGRQHQQCLGVEPGAPQVLPGGQQVWAVKLCWSVLYVRMLLQLEHVVCEQPSRTAPTSKQASTPCRQRSLSPPPKQHSSSCHCVTLCPYPFLAGASSRVWLRSGLQHPVPGQCPPAGGR